MSVIPETSGFEGLQYDRLCRTAHSEAYLVSDGEDALARVDLHFTPSIVYGILVLERELDDDEIRDLIARVDSDLVWTASVPRDDFVVTVYHGREVGLFSDADPGGDDEDEVP